MSRKGRILKDPVRYYQKRSNLIRLCEQVGVKFEQFGTGNHFRLFGESVLDYWPGSDRVWPTGSMDKGFKLPPDDVVMWAKTGVRP